MLEPREKFASQRWGGLAIYEEEQLILHRNVIRDVSSVISAPVRTSSEVILPFAFLPHRTDPEYAIADSLLFFIFEDILL